MSADPPPRTPLPFAAHALCGWPLILVVIGGAIGGALGGCAYVINLAIYRSRLPAAAKIALNLATGCAAVLVWVVIAASVMALVKGHQH
jgi:hypothetical protein